MHTLIPNPIVVVTGGRDYTPTHGHAELFVRFLRAHNPSVVRHGGAKGADTCAARAALAFAEMHSTGTMRVEAWPAAWSQHGDAAGSIRNLAMLEGPPKADVLIAFPGNEGTLDCLSHAERLGITIVRIKDL